MDRMEMLETAINEFANTEEQRKEALDLLNEYKPKIKKVISLMVYNKEEGKQISVLTSPDFNLKFFFKNIV